MESSGEGNQTEEERQQGSGGNSCANNYDDVNLEDFNQSELEDGDASKLGTTTMDHACLGDLSCSLLNCGDHDFSALLGDNIVDSFVEELKKRDKTIADLTSSLQKVVSRKGEGDVMLNAVETQLGTLAGGLKQTNFLEHTTTIVTPKKSVGTYTETVVVSDPEVDDDTDTGRRNNFVPIDKVVSGDKKLTEDTPNLKDGDDSGSDSDDEILNPLDRRKHSATEMNPDSLRLTFSPSICEYEAETQADFSEMGYLGTSTQLEDLKLQLSDTERKLESAKKYLEEMTLDREQEREDYQKTINSLQAKLEEGRREKERLDNAVEQVRIELTEMEDQLQKKEVIEEELLEKLQTSEFELNKAIEKIFELREIVRNLEEQVEVSIKKAESLAISKNAFDEDDVNVDSTHHPLNEAPCLGNSCLSEMEHTEELQALVDELAKRIEGKLLELENCSWQHRPGSSCSTKSVDDISVRISVPIPQSDEKIQNDCEDLVVRIFRGLRRLENSFDGLVRFEEVLLKRMKDTDVKITTDAQKIESLKEDNIRLKSELISCHKKIQEFECFLQENERRNWSSHFLYSANERLRHEDVSAILSPIYRNEQRKRVSSDETRQEQSFPINETQSMTQQRQDQFEGLVVANPRNDEVNNVNPTVPLALAPPSQTKETGHASKVLESSPTNTNTAPAKPSPVVSVPKDPPLAEKPKDVSANQPVVAMPILPETKQPSLETKQNEDVKGENSALTSQITDTGPKPVDLIGKKSADDDIATTNSAADTGPPPESQIQSEPDKNLASSAVPSEVEKEPSDEINPPSSSKANDRVSADSGVGSVASPFTPEEVIDSEKRPSREDADAVFNPDQEAGGMPGISPTGTLEAGENVDDPQSTEASKKRGSTITQVIETEFEIPVAEDGNPTGEAISGAVDGNPFVCDAISSDIIPASGETYQITTAADYEVDGKDIRYMGSNIIPSQDTRPLAEARDARLGGCDNMVQLEILKTSLDQTIRALELERQKNAYLAHQLQETSAYSNSMESQQFGDAHPAELSQEISRLADRLEQQRQREEVSNQSLYCAIKTIEALRRDNATYRGYVSQLQTSLQNYSTLSPNQTLQ